ncbi:hypothetical protein B0O99DRAFT_603456 [Bisporella sp. PMI_857]|nr:hypothetical protein B0O99DRAFT_603456 [Bisporella sp. PMI_857]
MASATRGDKIGLSTRSLPSLYPTPEIPATVSRFVLGGWEVAMHKAPAGQIHSPEEWESIRDTFKRIYQIERKTLREVREILASDYSFNATQLKKRINKWTAYKANQEINDISNLSASAGSSAAENDSPADYNTLEWSLKLPAQKSIELARFAIQIFFPLDIGQLKMNVSHRSGDWDLGRFYVLAQTISAHLAEREFDKARLLSIELDVLMKRIISDKNPVIPTCILQVCSRFWQENQVQGLQILLQYISATAHSSHPHHPLKLLCDALLHSLDVLPYLLVSISQITVGIASYHLTPDDPQTLSSQRGLYSALVATRDFHGALKVFTYVVDKEAECEREDTDATCAWRLDALIRLICCELSLYRLDDAQCNK